MARKPYFDKPCRNGPNCRDQPHCRFQHQPSQSECDIQVNFLICNLVYLTCVSFQCKYSNVPGGCQRQDCSYFHPDRSAQPADGSRRLLHDRLQRGRSRPSRENDRSSPYSHPSDRSPQGTNGSRRPLSDRLQRSTSSRENDRSSPYSHPSDRSPQAPHGSRRPLTDRLDRSTSSRENDRSSPYFHPADRSPQGTSSSSQFRRSRSRENEESSPKPRLRGENKRSIHETNNPETHGGEGDSPRLVLCLYLCLYFLQCKQPPSATSYRTAMCKMFSGSEKMLTIT